MHYTFADAFRLKARPCTAFLFNIIEKRMGKEELQQVVDNVVNKTLFCTKEVLTSDEAAMYMGISKSYLYKMTMRKEIPHYKPMGKVVYFNRSELEQWLQSNRVSTTSEVNQKAQAYCMKKGGVL